MADRISYEWICPDNGYSGLWNLNREILKINYKIYTDAVNGYLLSDLTSEQLSCKYVSEADVLNVVLFNKRAKQWCEKTPGLKGSMRDYANLYEPLTLANMESCNMVLIGKKLIRKSEWSCLEN